MNSTDDHEAGLESAPRSERGVRLQNRKGLHLGERGRRALDAPRYEVMIVTVAERLPSVDEILEARERTSAEETARLEAAEQAKRDNDAQRAEWPATNQTIAVEFLEKASRLGISPRTRDLNVPFIFRRGLPRKLKMFDIWAYRAGDDTKFDTGGHHHVATLVSHRGQWWWARRLQRRLRPRPFRPSDVGRPGDPCGNPLHTPTTG
jgi:hypothetical protein